MVARISVIALVMIVACPILLGFGMNLNETTITEYKSNDDPINVTQLLQTGTDWNVAYGDTYTLNASLRTLISNSVHEMGAYPTYNRLSSMNTNTPMYVGHVDNWNAPNEYAMGVYQEFQVWYDYNVNQGISLSATVLYNNGNSTSSTISNVIYLRYSASTEQLYILSSSNYNNSNNLSEYSITAPNVTTIQYTLTGGTISIDYNIVLKTGNNCFADLSEGFYFQKHSNKPGSFGWNMKMPENTTSVLMSINLDSITDSSYTMQIEQMGSYPMELIKTTTNGVVSWQLHRSGTGYFDLYYNPNISDNTYQVLLTPTGDHTGHAQFRYIGHWQKTIGEANYYQTYDTDYSQTNAQGNPLDTITIAANDTATSRTATIRIDAATFRAYEFPVINGTLNAAAFKNNPATTISNVEQYGTQLIFGGNTYNVTNGNITINSHQVPIKNMVLDSIPDDDTLQYVNRINGTTISTTAAPSTIQFVGNWSAKVTVSSMDQSSYTKTEWTPGQFAWDGIDTNFLMVGMLASLAAFIGLGIYARRHGGGVIPLMIVCGGAAVLFFCLI